MNRSVFRIRYTVTVTCLRYVVNSDQIEELEYEEDFDVTEKLRKLDLELENDGEASELLNLGWFSKLSVLPLLVTCW